MVFASIDSDGYGEAGSIVMFTALPPLGWDRYTDLDDAFPRGASTAGGSGGSTTHSHSVTIETGGPSSTSTAGGGGLSTATDTHTHSCSTTTGSASNLPPYLEVIYGQRKDPSPSASIGDEQEVGESGETVTYRYIYNGDGEMIAETIGLTTTIYIGNIYERKDQDGTITEKKTYYAGSLRVAVSTKLGAGSWEVNFLLSDHLGSTSTTVDASGDRIADLRYKSWGSIRYAWGDQVTGYTFNGHLSKVESFGLIYFKARWFDPSLGRFSSPDTIIPNAGFALDWDRYQLVRSNPLRFIDPSGHICWDTGHGLMCTDDDDSFDENGDPIIMNPYTPDDLDDDIDDWKETPEGFTDEMWRVERARLVYLWIQQSDCWWGDEIDIFILITILLAEEGSQLMNSSTTPEDKRLLGIETMVGLMTYLFSDENGMTPKDLSTFTAFFNPDGIAPWTQADRDLYQLGPQTAYEKYEWSLTTNYVETYFSTGPVYHNGRMVTNWWDQEEAWHETRGYIEAFQITFNDRTNFYFGYSP